MIVHIFYQMSNKQINNGWTTGSIPNILFSSEKLNNWYSKELMKISTQKLDMHKSGYEFYTH